MVNDEKCRVTSVNHHLPFTILNGDKIGERLAHADEAGIEPALAMYSRPAFANCPTCFSLSWCSELTLLGGSDKLKFIGHQIPTDSITSIQWSAFSSPRVNSAITSQT